MAEYIDIVSVKAAVASGALKVEVNRIGNILLIDPRSKESVKIGEVAADVAPVRHGRWIFEPETQTNTRSGYRCSVCRAIRWLSPDVPQSFKHCPSCGAKMDGEDKEKHFNTCGLIIVGGRCSKCCAFCEKDCDDRCLNSPDKCGYINYYKSKVDVNELKRLHGLGLTDDQIAEELKVTAPLNKATN